MRHLREAGVSAGLVRDPLGAVGALVQFVEIAEASAGPDRIALVVGDGVRVAAARLEAISFALKFGLPIRCGDAVIDAEGVAVGEADSVGTRWKLADMTPAPAVRRRTIHPALLPGALEHPAAVRRHYARAVRALVPFLWLCGPSGVGKSTVAWEIFSQLARAGTAAAYVDADQLGLCYPAMADDPDNHRIKARNLGAVWAAFRTAGVDSVVLSGGVESADLVGVYAGQVPGATLTLCRLRAAHATLIERFVRRGWMPQLVKEAVADADSLDRLDFADLCVDTDGLSVAEAARLVRERAGGWPASRPGRATRAVGPHGASAVSAVAADPVPVLLLCGATAVGKSTVGYEFFTRVRAGGIKAAYVDLAQIGFCQPMPADDPANHRLRAANLAAMWPAFRAAGARCLIVTGRVNDVAAIRVYAEAFPAARFTVCRLHAGRHTITDRILCRGRGGGPAILGDELNGQPLGRLHQIAEQAVRDADDLHRAGLGDLWVDTDKRTIDEVAKLITTKTAGWPYLTVRDPLRAEPSPHGA
jgi:hypothetical protein